MSFVILKLKNSIFICKKICMLHIFWYSDAKKRQLQSVELIQEFSATQKELISYAQALSLLLISKIDNLGEY